MKPNVLVIVGPTASGKSSLAIEIAKRINGVIISADSMQIYKKLDVGTAKVTKKEAQGIKHELIDIVEVDEKFSVSDYKKMCYEKIDEIISIGKTPIIVGGTGLYINAVVNNMNFEMADQNDEDEVDEKLKNLTLGKSDEQIYNLLYEMDSAAAIKIGKGNVKRLVRAIKLNLLGVKKSNIDERQDLWNKNESPYNFKVYYIDIPRDLLYDKINKRVDEMVSLGVLKEVDYIYNFKDKDITAKHAIGYKEFFPYIEGKGSLENCIEILKQKTRNYAKRQITWFKKLSYKNIIDGTQTKDEIIQNILKEYHE